MGDIVKKNNTMPIVPTTKPDKVETYGESKQRVLPRFLNSQTVLQSKQQKINKDGSITDKIEHRHM